MKARGETELPPCVLEDERFRKLLKQAEKQAEQSRKRRAEKEAKEAEKSREELGLGEGDDDLRALIQMRNENRKKEMDGFLAQMEEKYGNKPKKGGKKTASKKGKK